MKAISLLSGGLDSILATKLILEQGITVEAVNFVTIFCTCTKRNSSCLAGESAATQLGIPLKVFNISQEYLEVVRHPKHGYGSNLNPCIDCRIFTFKKAKEYMQIKGASFVVTGEVLGERPMSQKLNSLNLIEKESGLKGLIVRPLSAKLLKPSIPEENGWVDRNKFLSISGRSRKPQISLAAGLGIKDYPCPSGGCLLTDAGFANRMKDLISNVDALNLNDVQLLKIGRHFRTLDGSKIITGRNEEENKNILALAKDEDFIFDVPDKAGPLSLLRGKPSSETIELAAQITAFYTDGIQQAATETTVIYWQLPRNTKESISVLPIQKEELEKIRI